MAPTIKIEVRRTKRTSEGRQLEAGSKVESFDLVLSSSGGRTDEMTKEEFDVIQEKIATKFPGLRGRFVILHRGKPAKYY